MIVAVLAVVTEIYHHCSIQRLAVLKSPEETIIPCQLLFTLVFNHAVLLHSVATRQITDRLTTLYLSLTITKRLTEHM